MESAAIRRLTPADADSFSRLRLLGLESHPESFGSGADAWRSASLEQVRASLETGEDPAGRFVLGAFQAGELIGQIGFRRERRASLRHKGSVWGFIVHADHRRRGVGSGLLRAALDEVAACEGLQYVRAVVTTSGAAIRVFESHGFVHYGLETGGLRVASAAYDQAFLRHEIAPSH